MKRSIGLILSAITLGLAAAGMMLFVALMIVGVLAIKHAPTAPQQPPFVLYAVYGLTLVLVLLAAWAIVTMVGLLLLRVWARYSILVIGGLLAVIGALSSLGLLVSMIVSSSMMPSSPGLSPAAVHAIFGGVALFYALLAAVGVWWLIYFNRQQTKDLFLRRDRQTGQLYSPSHPPRRPTAVTILAILFLVAAGGSIVCAFLPFPAFVFGFILPARDAHALYAGIAIVAGAVGVGLLRLVPAARLATIAWCVIGCVNALLGLLPWYQDQFRTYIQQFSSIFPPLVSSQRNQIQYPAAQMAVYGLIGVAVNIYLIWLMHRDRAAFTAPPPAPAP